LIAATVFAASGELAVWRAARAASRTSDCAGWRKSWANAAKENWRARARRLASASAACNDFGEERAAVKAIVVGIHR
jgi:hypothetical protein